MEIDLSDGNGAMDPETSGVNTPNMVDVPVDEGLAGDEVVYSPKR